MMNLTMRFLLLDIKQWFEQFMVIFSVFIFLFFYYLVVFYSFIQCPIAHPFLAYFLNYSHEELTYLEIPLHSVLKITPKAYGCLEER